MYGMDGQLNCLDQKNYQERISDIYVGTGTVCSKINSRFLARRFVSQPPEGVVS